MPEDTMFQERSALQEPAPAGAVAEHPQQDLMDRVVAALHTVYDPEIPVDIWELGLVYRVDVDQAGKVEVDMTLTAPGCPVAGEMPIMVEQAVAAVKGVTRVTVELVWEPPWHPGRMSEAAQVQLDMF
ncbi:MAG: SUF system Fe-S cluster assembly protein [Azospirillaceae bacterium]|nr:SUF system Fe-S cluster assembly protein [Azospirillaceae bacterium]